ncbi:CSC1-like protein HYP1 isoform X2 [Magnolia sinica]|uniref:CSC1-like protein HYP1 isoform X2 n=1 Tax=Magnolia sinica TaxID=86752 RepID=UPI002659761B|nr:CSC1-like protein HYP1 isoform X2 [Magnolia sinica]
MIVSALLTSLGINFGLCILYFTLYSILRKQPGNIEVYAPRLVAEGKSRQESHFDLERLLPSTGWVRTAWQLSEEELLSASGLDAVVYMRIFIFRLWVHFCSAYLITGVVCFLLYYEYNYISSKRLASFYASRPQSHDFSVLVRGIPVTSGSSFSNQVESFFTEYHSSTYLSHSVVRRTSKLQGLISDAEKLYKKLTHLKSRPGQKFQRNGFLGLFGRKVDAVDHTEKRLQDLEENVRIQQSDVSLIGEEVPAAFVSFKSRYGAAIAVHIQQAINPMQWITEQAPEPNDVYWPFLSSTFLRIWISKLLVIVASIFLTVIFLIPVVFVQGLANLDQLEILLPFLKRVLSITFVSQVVTGYLPSLILQMFLSFVSPIMKLFSSMQGYISHSQIERSASSKVLWFTIWNVFFANVLSGSVISQLKLFLDLKNIPSRLAAAVPAQASFFITYVLSSGWTSVASEIARAIPLICELIGGCCSKSRSDEFDVPSFPYHKEIPRTLLFGLLGITYFLLAPLIIPFVLAYYALGYIVYRNQLLNVYLPKFETGGKFWPIVHNSTIFTLILMQTIAIGIFGLKKLPLASSLTLPLPVLTLLFNEYCRKCFLPIFHAYSAESLIKKDREDHSDPAMGEFFDKLVNAYSDPCMRPLSYSDNADRHISPLLGPAQV